MALSICAWLSPATGGRLVGVGGGGGEAGDGVADAVVELAWGVPGGLVCGLACGLSGESVAELLGDAVARSLSDRFALEFAAAARSFASASTALASGVVAGWAVVDARAQGAPRARAVTPAASAVVRQGVPQKDVDSVEWRPWRR
ncbi:hypothetical protein HC028_13310 [Planosporangium flavigriseum]|uniref:hypothetical protein n=1 Tax=Planosporangium flavigriseum TaxID=373681 RepID=UPI001438E6E8|nr:hypothetical protein [Planosporangium flavigriseum]NJC65476.1 hypothetical protein [Planosporangium flavigriseum]